MWPARRFCLVAGEVFGEGLVKEFSGMVELLIWYMEKPCSILNKENIANLLPRTRVWTNHCGFDPCNFCDLDVTLWSVCDFMVCL